MHIFFNRTTALITAMALGALMPAAHILSPAISYLIMFMLFCAFLDLRFNAQMFDKTVFFVLAANLIIPVGCYFLIAPFDQTLALIAFVTAATPTAISSPVIVGFLGGRVAYAVASVLLTNIVMAIFLPVALPFVAPAAVPAGTLVVLASAATVILVPLMLAQLMRWAPPRAASAARGLKSLSFPAWLGVLFIATASASYFIRTAYDGPPAFLWIIALVAAMVCIANFAIGYLLGGTDAREASQCLGQKNTMFTLWFSLSFLSPLIALGPAFYVLFHNLYNSYQLARHQRT